jgi:hypothetical protein
MMDSTPRLEGSMSKLKGNLTLVGIGLSAIALLLLPTGLAGLLVIIGCGLVAVVWDNYTRMGMVGTISTRLWQWIDDRRYRK